MAFFRNFLCAFSVALLTLVPVFDAVAVCNPGQCKNPNVFVTFCLPCTYGRYTTAEDTECNVSFCPYTIDNGYYSNGGGTSATPTANGSGDGTNGCLSPNSCGVVDAGYYSNDLSGKSKSTGNGIISAGYYSTGGATSKTPTSRADGGCVGQTGTGSREKPKKDTMCGPVDAGYFSTGGAKNAQPQGSVTRKSCVDSTDSEGNIIEETYCGLIKGGYFSTGGATNSEPGRSDCVGSNTCGQVEAGYYSEGGGQSSTPSSSSCGGQRTLSDGVTMAWNHCGLVDPGYYSTGGGMSAIPTANGPGDGNNGCLSPNSCGVVDAGYYSEGGGINKTGSCVLETGKCGRVGGGYFSTGGGTKRQPGSTDCVGSNTCGTVAGGYFSDGGGTKKEPGSTDCVSSAYPCSAGKVKAGYYSTGGASWNEPSATSCYGYQSDGTTPNACGLIDGGYWGEEGADKSTGTGKVAAGYYSTNGGTSSTPTANGDGCVGTGSDCGLIDAGYYGTEGSSTSTPHLIAAGYFSTNGGTAYEPNGWNDGCVGGKTSGRMFFKSLCGQVSAGYFSTGGGTSATPTANGPGDGTNGCVSGKYCGVIEFGAWGNGGSTSSRGSGYVDAGYYSTGGATSKTPKNGHKGPGQDTTDACVGQIDGKDTECGLIDPGYYSTGGALKSNPSWECNGGYVVTDGTIVRYTCGPIDAGYYRSSRGGKFSTDGWAIAGGYYSTGGAITDKPTSRASGHCVGQIKINDEMVDTDCGKLEIGYYSTGGAKSKNPAVGDCVGNQSNGTPNECGPCDVATNGAQTACRNDCGEKGGKYGEYVDENKICQKCPGPESDERPGAISEEAKRLYEFLPNIAEGKSIAGCKLQLTQNPDDVIECPNGAVCGSTCDTGSGNGKTEITYTWFGTLADGYYKRDQESPKIYPGTNALVVETLPGATELKDYCYKCKGNTPLARDGKCVACNWGYCLDSDGECGLCPKGKDCSKTGSVNLVCNNVGYCGVNSYSEEGYTGCINCAPGYSTIPSASIDGMCNIDGTGCNTINACVLMTPKLCLRQGCEYEKNLGAKLTDLAGGLKSSSCKSTVTLGCSAYLKLEGKTYGDVMHSECQNKIDACCTLAEEECYKKLYEGSFYYFPSHVTTTKTYQDILKTDNLK